jgi:hypothetical protein
MLTPSPRRVAVAWAQQTYHLSQRRAFGALEVTRLNE